VVEIPWRESTVANIPYPHKARRRRTQCAPSHEMHTERDGALPKDETPMSAIGFDKRRRTGVYFCGGAPIRSREATGGFSVPSRFARFPVFP